MPPQDDKPLHPWHPYEALYPAKMTRLARVVSALPIVAVVISVPLIFLGLGYSPMEGQAGLHPLTVTMLIPIAVAIIVAWICFRLVVRRAQRNDYEQCLKCSHPLTGLAADGECPRCRKPYTLELNRWAWKRACRHSVTPVPPLSDDPERQPRLTMDEKFSLLSGHPDYFAYTRRYYPMAFRRSIMTGLLASIAALLVYDIGLLVISRFISLPDVVGDRWHEMDMWAYLLLLAVTMFVLWRILARWKKRVSDLDGNMCLGCGYSLEGLPDMDQCPECGTAFSREATQSIWKRFRQPRTWSFAQDNKNWRQ
ncbi:MAG: hypothetical protein MK116_06245 [Phycisphaerales bacterium]|nr:hypothetical protein [Phycisphaerales bacterium]